MVNQDLNASNGGRTFKDSTNPLEDALGLEIALDMGSSAEVTPQIPTTQRFRMERIPIPGFGSGQVVFGVSCTCFPFCSRDVF